MACHIFIFQNLVQRQVRNKKCFQKHQMFFLMTFFQLQQVNDQKKMNCIRQMKLSISKSSEMTNSFCKASKE